LALRSNIAALGTALFALIVGDAHAQDAMTVAVGGRGIGESCVTEIGWNAGIFARHRLKLDIVYTDGGGETQQAVVSNSAQIGVTSGLLGAFSLYSKGAPVRIIGASYTGGRQVFWYVPASSSIKQPRASTARPWLIPTTVPPAMSGSWPCKSTSKSHSNRHQQATQLPPSPRP
jgi:NitT/TauT family transport system substrate-binding protein